jgi:hypothetical protein
MPTLDRAVALAKLTNLIKSILSDHVVVIPTTGGTVVITKRITLLNPAAGLATLTVTLPASPGDGVQGIISSTRAITTLTVNGNGNTVANAPTTLAAGGSFGYIFDSAGAAWLRIS